MLYLLVTKHLWEAYHSSTFYWLYSTIHSHVTFQVDYLLLLNFSNLFVLHQICSHVHKTSLHLSNLVLQFQVFFLKLLKASKSLLHLLFHLLVIFFSQLLLNLLSYSLFLLKGILHTCWHFFNWRNSRPSLLPGIFI